MRYLITGATGDVGSRVTRQLLECGIRPRVLVRSEEKARRLFGNRVDVWVGDLAAPASTRGGFERADAVFLVNVGPEIPERDEAAAAIAREAGVRKIVKLSSLDVEQGLAIGAWHEKGEAAIREAGIPFTMVRPTGFMSNLLAWAHSIRTEGMVRSSTGDGRRPFIHSEDIASICVAALVSDEYPGQALPITGPESLTFGDATAIIGQTIGKPLRYRAISDEEARERYSRISGSPEETEAHIALWRAIREGRLAATTDGVKRILGREPIALRQWALENASAFLD
ncbi:MAG TPA: NAD(P)H-binding protein [Acidobacteriaceae bacterium]|nr:NAD(P)H-binding protein [Acidobacteriaceae bacterium]